MSPDGLKEFLTTYEVGTLTRKFFDGFFNICAVLILLVFIQY